MLYVNTIGGQDSLVFDGASFAIDANGVCSYVAASFKVVLASIQLDQQNQNFINLNPKPPSFSAEKFSYHQIILGLKDYARRCGFSTAVIGSSGGIDSAVTIALAVAALGKNNVVAITMPSAYSSAGSISDSEILCANLDIKLYNHPIKALVDQYASQFADTYSTPLQGVALENLQARIRGTILMEHSNQFGALLLTTGNKSEMSVGYCTLYGDTNGGLGLLGDLYKNEVYSLAQMINQQTQQEIIPLAIISKAPSAELAPEQKDSDSLPNYDTLDNLLKFLIEGHRLAKAEYKEVTNFVSNYLKTDAGRITFERIKTMIARNEYKRRQAPPIIRIRARAFGTGRQIPITAKY